MEKIRVGVIPAAGRGVRAYPKTRFIPKCMLDVAGKPLIQWNIELMRDKMGVKRIYIITGHLGHAIREHFGNGKKFGVDIFYLEQPERKGIGHAISLAEPYIREPFVVILGDEVYTDSNHNEIRKISGGFDAVCFLKETEDTERIKKNYSVKLKNGMIVGLEEKPKNLPNNFLGCGTYIFKPKVFDFIRKTGPSALRGEIEITNVIDNMTKSCTVLPFFMKGGYFNINTIEDLHTANYVRRASNFDKYKISVVIPAYNEEKTVGDTVEDFLGQKVYEVVVVDNNSKDRTAAVAKKCGARVVKEFKQGYGHAIRCGMNVAKGDIIILAEADSTFRAKDLGKILEYMKDADMVIGTRTTRQMIEQGANMDWFLRWGNVFLGKLVEFLWWKQEPRFTDVGCTYRGIWKDFYEKIKDNLGAPGPAFSVEMMIEVLKAKGRIIEIPVSYYRRSAGVSKHSDRRLKAIRNGLRMLEIIMKKV